MNASLDAHRPLYEVKANLFKGLAHPVRVRILEILTAATQTETPGVLVSELLSQTGLEASHLSGHLAILRTNNLVTATRKASQVSYTLAYPAVADLLTVARALLVEILQRSQQHLDGAATLPPLPPRSNGGAAATTATA